ncbi:hypothetical protein [uncultured Roseivirga sp.]|tara:strand:+ start:1655 stop:1792 length:138 start_codon:yes stop_codon:yes gene_type:complete
MVVRVSKKWWSVALAVVFMLVYLVMYRDNFFQGLLNAFTDIGSVF